MWHGALFFLSLSQASRRTIGQRPDLDINTCLPFRLKREASPYFSRCSFGKDPSPFSFPRRYISADPRMGPR